MKIGFILECAPGGPDSKVYPYLAAQIRDDLEIVPPKTMVNKALLVKNCGAITSILLSEGCDLVLVIWDLRPPWKVDGGQPCLHEDRTMINQSLTETGVDISKVGLVCNIAMLEAWLLADKRAIVLTIEGITGKRPNNVPSIRNPDRIPDPKNRLIKIFGDCSAGMYVDNVHAEKIVKNLSHLDKIRRLHSFELFEDYVVGRRP